MLSKRTLVSLVTALLLSTALPFAAHAKGYSSGGRSYSSHSSSSSSHSFSSGSHTFSSGSSHSSSGTSTHTFSGGGSGARTFSSGSSSNPSFSHTSGSGTSATRTFNSGSGKSYSSGSTWSDSGRHSYSSGKSYSSGGNVTSSSSSRAAPPPIPSSTRADSTPLKSYSSGNRTFSSGSEPGRPSSSQSLSPKSSPDPASSSLTFDTAAARAQKQQTSKSEFNRFKDSKSPPPAAPSAGSYRAQPPPIPSSGGSFSRTPTYIPTAQTISTRPVRIYNYYSPYYTRPVVYYHDPYNSFFWWWLLDRSLDDRAYWAYHHRYDMDPARYQALMATDQQLETRVAQLEAQQVARDPNYVPPALDENRDLMYTDRYVNHTYSNRPTRSGNFVFWFLAIPTAVGVSAFFIWLIWFKRWQTAAA